MRQYVINSRGTRLTKEALSVDEAMRFKRAMEIVVETLDENENPMLDWDFERVLEDEDQVVLTWGRFNDMLQEFVDASIRLAEADMTNEQYLLASIEDLHQEFSIEVQTNTVRR